MPSRDALMNAATKSAESFGFGKEMNSLKNKMDDIVEGA